MLACRALQPRLASDASVVFFSSVATGKGSYDPSYAAAKSALEGLMHSLANVMPNQRFNIIRLGLVEGSPVHLGMTEDFVTKHKQRMRNGHLVAVAKVASMTKEVLLNACLNRAVIQLDGGYL
jgi:3-oxoacyl-[acyl-carrier protein] reductase